MKKWLPSVGFGVQGVHFGGQRSDGAQMFADDLHLVQLEPQRADLLFQVVATQSPLFGVRVQSAAAVDLLFVPQLTVEDG